MTTSFYYGLIGGGMLASSIYHLLYYNGSVLGVSGIYGSFIERVIAIIQSTFLQEVSQERATKSGSSETDRSVNINTHPTSKATPKEDVGRTEEDDETWKTVFVLGLFCSGLLIKALRPLLERRLGIPILDDRVIEHTSNHV